MALRVRLRAQARLDVDLEVAEDPVVIEAGGVCGQLLTGRGQERLGVGRTCQAPAGTGTSHFGYGPCKSHRGNTAYHQARGAWLMGHAIARPLGITPWEALLGQLRRQAGTVAFLDQKVAEASQDDDLAPGGSHAYWYTQRQVEGDRLAKYSKMALDAGVAERFIAQVEWEGEQLTLMLNAVINDSTLGFTDEQKDGMRGKFRRELLALEARSLEASAAGSVTVEGEIIEEEDNGESSVGSPWSR